MILDEFLSDVQNLRKTNDKYAYFVAKELAMIGLNVEWFPEQREDNARRLRSLAGSIRMMAKGDQTRMDLADNIVIRSANLNGATQQTPE